jgi:choice-of-anchor A domain-containing protein
VAPEIANGSDLNVGAGTIYVNPAPSSSSYTLNNNGSGQIDSATTTTPLPFSAVTNALQADAASWSTLSPTGQAAYSNGGSVLTLTGSNPNLNVFDLSTSLVSLPTTHTTVEIDTPANSTVLINVGSSWTSDIAKITSLSSSPVSASHIIWNFASASQLNFGNAEWLGTVFAPSAAFTGGAQIDGDLIVGSLAPNTNDAIPEVHASGSLFTGLLPQPTAPISPTPPKQPTLPPSTPTFVVTKTFDGSTGPVSVTLPPIAPLGGYSYTIAVDGTGTIADPLVLSDSLPSYTGLTYQSATINTINGLHGSCTTTLGVLTCAIASSSTTPVALANQSPIGTITIPLSLASSIRPGTFSNTATLAYDGTKVATSNTVTTNLVAASTSPSHPISRNHQATPPSAATQKVTSTSKPVTEAKSIAQTTPQPVKLVTGPPATPTTSTSALEDGLALIGLGAGAFAAQAIRRRHRRRRQLA